jgi:hypothetical protein
MGKNFQELIYQRRERNFIVCCNFFFDLLLTIHPCFQHREINTSVFIVYLGFKFFSEYF